MAEKLNLIELKGMLLRNPDVVTQQVDGETKKVAYLSLIVDAGRDKTEQYKVRVAGRLAEKMGSYKKGDNVYVRGSISYLKPDKEKEDGEKKREKYDFMIHAKMVRYGSPSDPGKRAFIIGRIGADPEVKEFEDRNLLRLYIMTSYAQKTDKGWESTNVQGHNVSISYSKEADMEKVKDAFRKGSLVAVMGMPKLQEADKGRFLNIIPMEVEVLKYPRDEERKREGVKETKEEVGKEAEVETPAVDEISEEMPEVFGDMDI